MAEHLPERLVYSINDAAAALDISRSQMYRLISKGEIKSIKFGVRGQRVPASELNRWVEQKLADAGRQD